MYYLAVYHREVCVDENCFIFVDFLKTYFFFLSKCFLTVQLHKRINEIKKLTYSRSGW